MKEWHQRHVTLTDSILSASHSLIIVFCHAAVQELAQELTALEQREQGVLEAAKHELLNMP